MGTPYKKIAVITKPSGTAVSATVPHPSYGSLCAVVVRQENPADTSGTDAFTVDVFDQDPTGFTPDNPEEIHKVIPTQNGAAGKMEYFASVPLPYVNLDTDGGLFGIQRKLYVRISGVGTGDFHVALVGLGGV